MTVKVVAPDALMELLVLLKPCDAKMGSLLAVVVEPVVVPVAFTVTPNVRAVPAASKTFKLAVPAARLGTVTLNTVPVALQSATAVSLLTQRYGDVPPLIK